MKKTVLTLVAGLLFAVGSVNAQVIYSANFANTVRFSHNTGTPPTAGPISLDGGNWTIGYTSTPATDGSTNTFGTDGDTLDSSDFGGAGFFFTDSIDVSLYDAVNISGIGATAFGTQVFNTFPTEFFRWSYTLDGGSPVNGPSISADGSLNTPAGWSNIDTTGFSSLVIRFDFNINGDNDGFSFSSLNVTAVPEPSTYALIGLGLGALWFLRQKKTATKA